MAAPFPLMRRPSAAPMTERGLGTRSRSARGRSSSATAHSARYSRVSGDLRQARDGHRTERLRVVARIAKVPGQAGHVRGGTHGARLTVLRQATVAMTPTPSTMVAAGPSKSMRAAPGARCRDTEALPLRTRQPRRRLPAPGQSERIVPVRSPCPSPSTPQPSSRVPGSTARAPGSEAVSRSRLDRTHARPCVSIRLGRAIHPL